ncbi:MAG: hypothetical protein O2895_06950, partial [Chloroflexi bacterium]|nr:hypothetical protein [Chloroflexota bacterium]
PSGTEPATTDDAAATDDAATTPTRTATPSDVLPVEVLITLDQAVERCLAGLRSGAVTLAQCQARWAEYADRLEARVCERLQALQDQIGVEQALQFCVRHIEAGELTPEGCLLYFPWLAAQLRPLLREALPRDALPLETPSATDGSTTAEPVDDRAPLTPTGTPTAAPAGSLDSSATR